MRQVTLSECSILNTVTPPHGDAVMLVDLDGDGHNELCIASAGGYFNIFKSHSDQSTPWASGCVGHGDEIVLLSFGMYLKETLMPLLVVVTASSALLVKVGTEESPTELIFTGVHAPRNVTAGVTLPDTEDPCTDVLVVGTYDGDLHIIRFDNVMPMETLSHGNMSNDLKHIKHFEEGISSLARVGNSNDVMLVIGLVDGSFEMLKWPSLESFHRGDDDMGVHSDIRKDARCVNVDYPAGARFCVSTLSGDLTLCELMTSSESSELLTYSLGVEIEVDEPLIAMSQLPPLTSQTNSRLSETSPSLFAVTSCSGKTVILECSRDLLNADVTPSRDVASCVFDPASLFTAPLKGFVTGGYRPAHRTPVEQMGSPLTAVTNGGSESVKDEPCLIYVLGNGEVLVFHSLVSQIGDEIRPLPLLERLAKDLPELMSQLRGVRVDTCVSASGTLLSPEAANLRKILYSPTSKLTERMNEAKEAATTLAPQSITTEDSVADIVTEGKGDRNRPVGGSVETGSEGVGTEGITVTDK